ncbi:MAG: XisI protein [Cytophagaceae bacterium]|nr:XisI protein [Cytophagaceae bacterium]
METLKKYQQILIDFLEEYASIQYVNAPEPEQQVIADLQRNHFQLVSMGWHKGRFVHDVVFHFDIKDGKIFIRQNWSDLRLAKELTTRGVAPPDIVVGSTPAAVPA